MGTLFRIIIYTDSEIKAQAAATAAFNRIDNLNKILSDYDPSSELSRLSRLAGTGQALSLSPDLWYLLQKSMEVSKKTNGAFDVTVGPIVQLWRRARRQQTLPPDSALTQARRLVNYQHIILNPTAKTAQLLLRGMQLDMGAIGKGYAVDEAMKVLKSKGIEIALVDGGGNILVSQAPPQSKGWAIDLLTSPTPNQQPKKIYLTNRGVATSGDLYQYVELNDTRYSHIVNPFTGLGLIDQRHVTIIAQNATAADWLSTALSVMSPAEGLALVQKVPRAAAYIVKREKAAFLSWQSKRYHHYLKRNELN